MTALSTVMTLEEFIAFANQPENSNLSFEFIDGEMITLSPARTSHSWIENLIVVAIVNFCRTHSVPVFTTSGDGTYLIAEQVIVPDVAYKPTPMSDDYPDPVPPLIAVEIISPSETIGSIRRKRAIYAQANILYWEIYPEEKLIDVYEPGKNTRTLGIDDSLDGGTVIPGFTLPLRELFPA